MDPVLFALSYDYVGDLAETVALVWPRGPRGANREPELPRWSTPCAAHARRGPRLIEGWLDALDATAAGRC